MGEFLFMSVHPSPKIFFLTLSSGTPKERKMLSLGHVGYPCSTNKTPVAMLSHPKQDVFFSCASGSTAILKESEKWIIVGRRKHDVNYDRELVSVKFSPKRIDNKEIFATVGGFGYIHFWVIRKRNLKYSTPVRVEEMYRYKISRPDFVNEIAPPTPASPDDRDDSSDSQNYDPDTLDVTQGHAVVDSDDEHEEPATPSDGTHSRGTNLADSVQDLDLDPVQQIVAESVQLHQKHEDEFQQMTKKLVTWIGDFEAVRERQKEESDKVINKLKDVATAETARVEAVRQETTKMQNMLESGEVSRKNMEVMCSTILDLCSNSKDEGASGAASEACEVTPPPKKRRRKDQGAKHE